MYTSYMFHTNQVPIVKGLIQRGHKVSFVCQSQGANENHAYFKPYVLGHSKLFNFINFVYRHLFKVRLSKSSFPEKFEGIYGFPPVFKFMKLLKTVQPDLVIVRERIVYSIFCYLICKHKKIKCVLYNQNPIWSDESPKNDVLHKFVRKLTPEYRMTPVLGKRTTNNFKDLKAIYIPFVIDGHLSPGKKEYFKNNKINILCVGKYEKRKNQMMLVDVFKSIANVHPCTLTFVGEVSTKHHQDCFDKVNQYVIENNLSERVFLNKNCKPEDMGDFYREADLFVLPSTGEFASVSQLEAMSYSLPVIVSDTNGTSCYIEENENGFLFEDNNPIDLREKIERMINSREEIKRMGQNSYYFVEKKYCIEKYEEKLFELMNL